MKILFFTSVWPVFGGGETFLRFLKDALVKNNHQVIIATHKISDQCGHEGDNIYSIPEIKNSIFCRRDRSIERICDEIICKEKPDICHLNVIQSFGLAPLYVAQKHAIPTVFTFNDYFTVCGNTHLFYNSKPCSTGPQLFKCFFCEFISSDPHYKNNYARSFLHGLRNIHRMIFYRKELSKFTKIICPSHSTIEYLQLCGGPKHNVELIVYPFKKTTIAEDNCTKVDSERAGYVTGGRLVRYKGFQNVIKCFNNLQLPLTIIGRGVYEEWLKKLAGPQIAFTGFLKQDELYYVLQKSKAFIAPSLWPETGGPPYAIMDCYATGTPVIASSVGGHIEGVDHEKTGFLYSPTDPAELQKYIALIQNGWQPDYNTINNYLSNREPEKIVERYMAVYNSLL